MRLRKSAAPAPPNASPAVSTPAPTAPTSDDAVSFKPAAPLGELLLHNGVLTPEQLADAIVKQAGSGKRLGELLVDLGLVDEREIIAALATQMGLPFANLREEVPDPDLAASLSESLARSLNAIPLRRTEDGTVVVAVSDPRPDLVVKLRAALGGPASIALASAPEVRWAIDNVYPALRGVNEQVEAFVAVSGRTVEATATAAMTEVTTEDAPVVQIVNMIITQALRDRASDIHIEPQDDSVRVRFRIDGALHEVLELPASMGSAIASRLKIMGGMSIVERRRPQDGQITMTVDGRALDIRVATTGVIWGEKVVLRLLDKSRPLFRLRDLGISGDTLDAFTKMLHSPYGMVLCAGPTGSGKTTTLYAALNAVNSSDRNITTIEDPVEYVFPSINQIQINEAAGITFAGGLKAILRQDPDMILVGEIRDVETARIAVQSALTGHFVLSSVHATDSVSSLYRFIDMGVESFLIAASVLGIVGQRLVRRTCRDCKVPYTPSTEELAFFESAGGNLSVEFWRGLGCNYCSHTGYSDRIGVYELLTVTEEMRELLVQPDTTHADLRALAIAQGMIPLRTGGARLVEEGVTTIAEIIRSIYTL